MRDVRASWGAELALPIRARLRRAVFLTAMLALASLARLALAAPSCWNAAPSMPAGRDTLATIGIGGTLYAVGGYNGGYLSTVEAYDTAAGVWFTRSPMPSPRNGPAVGVINGQLLVAGGGIFGQPENALEIFDPATNAWTVGNEMPTPRYGPSGAVVGGTLYVAGGEDTKTGFLAAVEAYDPATGSWTAVAAMPTARTEFAAGVIAGKIYAVGGWNGAQLDALEVYDPATNTWTTKAPMPTRRSGLAVVVVGGTLYAIGGDAGGSLAVVEAYDPATDSWTSRCGLQTPRAWLGAATVAGTVYAVGGWDTGYLATMESVALGDLPILPAPGPALVTTVAVSNPTPRAGDTITVTITVRNVGLAGAVAVAPALTFVEDPGLLYPIAGPAPGGGALASGGSVTAVWTYRLASNGRATFTAGATGRHASTNQPVTSRPATVTIGSPPAVTSPVVVTGGATGPVNPSQGDRVTIAFYAPLTGTFRISFMTYGGRVVHAEDVHAEAGTWNRASWDLRNRTGAFIAPGVYGVSIRGPGVRERSSFVAGR